jgi:hypothetical protein
MPGLLKNYTEELFMKKILVALISTGVLVGGNMAYAADAVPEAATTPHKGGRAAIDCSKAAEPAKCEARRKERRERFEAASKACEGKEGDDKRACMREQFKDRAGARQD